MTTTSPQRGAAFAVDRDGSVSPLPARLVGGIGRFLGRSLFPVVALALILGTLLWGPWVTLVLALLWWHLVTRIG